MYCLLLNSVNMVLWCFIGWTHLCILHSRLVTTSQTFASHVSIPLGMWYDFYLTSVCFKSKTLLYKHISQGLYDHAERNNININIIKNNVLDFALVGSVWVLPSYNRNVTILVRLWYVIYGSLVEYHSSLSAQNMCDIAFTFLEMNHIDSITK